MPRPKNLSYSLLFISLVMSFTIAVSSFVNQNEQAWTVGNTYIWHYYYILNYQKIYFMKKFPSHFSNTHYR